MLIEFSLRNYLSIKQEVKLSLLATTLKESLAEPNATVPLSDTGLSLLRSGVIYGANASGKSNLLKALAFFRRFVTESFRNGQAGDVIDVEPFRLNSQTAHEPTMMEAVFTDGAYIYRYGFEVTSQVVVAEWLYQRSTRKRAKEVELLYRELGHASVHPQCALVKELVTKRMIRDNALILSTAAQFNEPKAVSILRWLADTQIIFCSEDERLWQTAIRHLDDESLRSRIIAFARYADLGIDEISKIDNGIISRHRQYDNEGLEVNNVSFSFRGNESEGTIKYFSLSYPIIDALDHGKRIIIDELDSKLHPLLVRKIVMLFNSPDTNPNGAQLLFTAHDTYLLSAGLFRRDQIWFTQKDSFGATGAYSLAEYKVESSSPFERDYLQGRYGATPILGDMETIFTGGKVS